MRILPSIFTIVIFSLWILPALIPTQAKEGNQFINIVNPVRISSYTKDPVSSLSSEYEEIKKRNLAATWLLTHDVIQNNNLILALKQMDKNQELGIFMEVTPTFAEQAQVVYRKTDSWHRANSLFLSGYTQEERKKLIDEVFNQFKEAFGFYPTSVGAWWIDSFSLEYMKNKYGVTANLTCADQFQTDGYRIWGQYWGYPFYSSKHHAGIPAKDASSSLDIVTIQWAPRDPLNGYNSSAYSTQDYFTLGLDLNYFEKLIRLYAQENENKFGQITLGLEGDLTAGSYKGIYADQMQLVSGLRDSNNFKVVTMKQFSEWYRSQFKDKTPEIFIETDDLLNANKKAIWYQSSNYRIGLVYDEKNSKLTIVDLRVYFNDFQEPYYLSPNFQLDLFINTPSVIDSINNPNNKWEIKNLKLKSIEKTYDLLLVFENNKKIKFASEKIIFYNFNNNFNLPSFVKDSSYLNFKNNVNSFVVTPKTDFNYKTEGLTFPDLSITATYFLWRPKVYLTSIGVIVFLIVISLIILSSKKKRITKYKLLSIFYLPVIAIGTFLLLTNYQIYQVNQAEIDALNHLAALPYGRVVVARGGCLICKWETAYPPPAYANKKDYVGWFAHKPIVYNATVFQATSRPEGRKQLNKLGAKYIYLVRYKGYLEEMPFSPGDLNVEKIYENANTQIWQVKNN